MQTIPHVVEQFEPGVARWRVVARYPSKTEASTKATDLRKAERRKRDVASYQKTFRIRPASAA